jgi:hypothetical protein
VIQAAAHTLLPVFDLFPIGICRGFHSAHRAEHFGVVSASGKNRPFSTEKTGKAQLLAIIDGDGGLLVLGHALVCHVSSLGDWVGVDARKIKIRQVVWKANVFFLHSSMDGGNEKSLCKGTGSVLV